MMNSILSIGVAAGLGLLANTAQAQTFQETVDFLFAGEFGQEIMIVDEINCVIEMKYAPKWKIQLNKVVLEDLEVSQRKYGWVVVLHAEENIACNPFTCEDFVETSRTWDENELTRKTKAVTYLYDEFCTAAPKRRAF